jgi:hypothetical protein
MGSPKAIRKKRNLKIAGSGELNLPVSDKLNVWDQEFGWVLKDGKPTASTKPYWAAMRRKAKQ